MVPAGEVYKGIAFMGLFYIVGCQFYILRIPERFLPGFFDIWFNSHSIWHGFVLAAALVHYYNLINIYVVRTKMQCMVV